MPRITVILSSLNHAKYLAAAIESVLDQTFTDFEFFIVDDASEDESWEIIERYRDPRIVALRNQKRMRGAYGFNEVILNRSQGEYISIHHSDDIFSPYKLERQLAYLDANPEVGAVFSRVEVIDDEGFPFLDQSHFYSSVFQQHNRNRFDWLRYFFFQGNCLCHPSLLARRSAYLAAGLYDRRFGQIPDFELWIRMCLQHEIHILDEPLVKFRVRAGEANQSGDRQETKVRSANEHLLALRHYATIEDTLTLHRIFSEIPEHCSSRFAALHHLALLAMRTGSGTQRAFGLELLYSMMADADTAAELEKIGFGYTDLIALSGQYDFFRSSDLYQANADSKALEIELNRVKKTLSWRITRPFRLMAFLGHRAMDLLMARRKRKREARNHR